MYAYLNGVIAYKNPTYIVLDVQGVGYMVHISLQTYSHVEPLKEVRLWTELIVREDAMTIYGFFTEEEKKLFTLLINVNGVGANTARLILSGLSTEEFQHAILTENVSALQQIKGIGKKTAQRLILDLKDKIHKGDSVDIKNLTDGGAKLSYYSEAESALQALGFPTSRIKKAMHQIHKENRRELNTEQIIKTALKILS